MVDKDLITDELTFRVDEKEGADVESLTVQDPGADAIHVFTLMRSIDSAGTDSDASMNSMVAERGLSHGIGRRGFIKRRSMATRYLAQRRARGTPIGRREFPLRVAAGVLADIAAAKPGLLITVDGRRECFFEMAVRAIAFNFINPRRRTPYDNQMIGLIGAIDIDDDAVKEFSNILRQELLKLRFNNDRVAKLDLPTTIREVVETVAYPGLILDGVSPGSGEPADHICQTRRPNDAFLVTHTHVGVSGHHRKKFR